MDVDMMPEVRDGGERKRKGSEQVRDQHVRPKFHMLDEKFTLH